jgi:hypothetical protein
VTRAGTPLADRLDSKSTYVPFCGCKIWYGASVPRGYGVIADRTHGKRQEYTHRTAWELANGPIPQGMFVLHTCDEPACINPDHLFIGTPLQNMQDMISKGRQDYRKNRRSGAAHPLFGRRIDPGIHSQSRLSWAQVAEIRALYQPGVKQSDIAKLYGIKQPQVSAIIRRTSWKV